MKPLGPEREIRYARILGMGFIAAGFLAVILGWAGTARRAAVDSQFPYLLSGGAAGIGLIVFGVGLLIVAQIRAERLKLTGQLEQMTSALTKATLAASPSASSDGQVVVGQTTYHLPDCRLVQGKEDLELVTVEAARRTGLSPCRVCMPEAAEAGEEEPAPAAVGAGNEPPSSTEIGPEAPSDLPDAESGPPGGG